MGAQRELYRWRMSGSCHPNSFARGETQMADPCRAGDQLQHPHVWQDDRGKSSRCAFTITARTLLSPG